MHKQKNGSKSAGRRLRQKGSGNSKAVIRWLVFCFPAGLLMMWSDRCRWSRMTKSAVSCTIAVALALVVVPQTLPPERAKGGVQIVSQVPVAERLGPEQISGAGVSYEVYLPEYVNPTSVVIAPTPTPVPVYVYCNEGGKNYHNKKCRYVKNGTARVSLNQATSAGYTRCAKCDAPEEYLG